MSLEIRILDKDVREHTNIVLFDLCMFKLDIYKSLYPGVLDWYERKLIPGFLKGERIIRILASGNNIYGMSILRVSDAKVFDKLCTFYLLPEARSLGFGNRLMRETLEDQKLRPGKGLRVTVPEERAVERIGGHSLLDFFDKFGLRLSAAISSRYRNGRIEYVCQANPIIHPLADFRCGYIPSATIKPVSAKR